MLSDDHERGLACTDVLEQQPHGVAAHDDRLGRQSAIVADEFGHQGFTPRLLGPIRGYVQVFSGYGETMIDYNWKQTTVGIGIAVSDGL